MKLDVPGYPRTGGHLTECLVVAEYEATCWLGDPWPPQDELFPYCTCENWGPD